MLNDLSEKPLEDAEYEVKNPTTETDDMRSSLIEKYIYSHLPVTDFRAAAVKRSGVPVENLSTEWKEWIYWEQHEYEEVKNSITRTFAQTKLTNAELPGYIHEALALQNELARYEPRTIDIKDFRYSIESIVRHSESTERIKLWQNKFEQWKNVFMADDPENVRRGKLNDFGIFMAEMSATRKYPKSIPAEASEIDAQFLIYLKIKDYLYRLPESLRKQPDSNKDFVRVFERAFFDIATKSHSPEQASYLFQIFKGAVEKNVDPELAKQYISVICDYARQHSLSERSKEGVESKLLHALKNGDPQVSVLQKEGNKWGMTRGDFGVGDFTVHAYAVEVNPKNVNELLMALREIPTSDAAKYEQNRTDALALSGIFSSLRDFIHDQRPLVREVIHAMVTYQNTHNRSELATLLPKTSGYLTSNEMQDTIFNLASYDEEVETQVNKSTVTEKAIDVLKRLEQNTKVIEQSPPASSDPELNRLLLEFENDGTQSTVVLENVLDRINGILLDACKKKEVGIDPSMILAIAWIERQYFQILQNISYEEQQGLYKKHWFTSVLKFQELTASARTFNEKEWDNFVRTITGTKNPSQAYKLIQSRTLTNISDLAAMYSNTNKPYISGALWSGNIAHELIALTDPKSALTSYGEKHRKENETPLHSKNTGD